MSRGARLPTPTSHTSTLPSPPHLHLTTTYAFHSLPPSQVTSSAPVAVENADDDLERELAFYNQVGRGIMA